jgi:hypothetical protein
MRLFGFTIQASIAATAAIATNSDAGIIAFTQKIVWDAFTTTQGAGRSVETFDAYSGFYPSPLTGTSGGVTWSAGASGGLFVGVAGGSSSLSTNAPGALTIDLSGAAVRGIGANVFGTDIDFNVVPSVVQVTLADGTNYFASVSTASNYMAFWSTSAAITSITFGASAPAGQTNTVYPTVDNLTFAVVPGPATCLILVAAGACSRRRRA